MITLAIDFSTERRAVCVTDHAGREGVALAADRAAGVLGLIEQALATAGISRSEIGRIALGLGPGSYTGIRSSIALAQGWRLAAGVELVGLSSVEVMARSVRVEGLYDILVDAQKGEFYRARFRRTGERVERVADLAIVGGGEVDDGVTRCSPEPGKLSGGVIEVLPDVAELARMAVSANPVAAEDLAPVYLRAAEFKKAPPPREIV